MFLKIYFNPSAAEGPNNMLFARNLIVAFSKLEPVLVNHFWHIFVNHAENWLGGPNLALSTFSKNPPFSLETLKDPEQRLPKTINFESLLRSRCQLRSFFTRLHKKAPCLERGDRSFWSSVHNHNQSCERYLGWLQKMLKSRALGDFNGEGSDHKMRGYVLNMRKRK